VASSGDQALLDLFIIAVGGDDLPLLFISEPHTSAELWMAAISLQSETMAIIAPSIMKSKSRQI